MPRFRVALAAAFTSVVLTLSARQAPPQQAGPPPAAVLQPPAPDVQQPVFRGRADVIRLDVSVLDKDRKPVRGLTENDFTVLEDGKSQRIVAVAEVDAEENDPEPTAWMRHVTSEIAYNDLSQRIGDGRLFAIILDDVNVPWDDLDIIRTARDVARDVVDHLGPSDVAAIVFPRDGGQTEDFTNDREKLLDAIDRFNPREPDPYSSFEPAPAFGGDTQRSSRLLSHSACDKTDLAVPAFETVVARLATVPNRRKTIVYVSPGADINFGARAGCPGELKDRMLDVFGTASRANINIYSIDPAGYGGYERYLRNPIRRGGRPATGTENDRMAQGSAKMRQDFLETMADYTGATATVNSDEVASGINGIFTESSSYYLIGYQTANGQPDGKYRKIEVKVRSGLTVRTRSGYFAPKNAGGARDAKGQPTTNDLGLIGLVRGAALPLSAMAVPVALTGHDRDADVAVVLTVTLPAPRADLGETVTIVRNLYDSESRPGPPIVDRFNLVLAPPTSGDELRYDLIWHLMLAPGRYQLRLNATSKTTEGSGSVYPDIEVPDFTRARTSLSSLVLGAKPLGPRTDPLASVLPIVPTTARDFAPGDDIAAFVRVFQGSAAPVGPVVMNVQVLDVHNAKKMDATATLTPDAFGGRAAGYQFDLPLKQLEHGPYVVSVTATPVGGPPVRRDLVFRVR
jgi:VWFA-related protein